MTTWEAIFARCTHTLAATNDEKSTVVDNDRGYGSANLGGVGCHAVENTRCDLKTDDNRVVLRWTLQ